MSALPKPCKQNLMRQADSDPILHKCSTIQIISNFVPYEITESGVFCWLQHNADYGIVMQQRVIDCKSYVGLYGTFTLRWRHNGCDSVSNHHCLLNRLFRRRSKKTSKLRVTGLCAENSPGTGEFPAQRASNAENVSIWWRHHVERNPDTQALDLRP